MKVDTPLEAQCAQHLENIDQLCWERLDKGEKKYGTWLAFLERDTYRDVEEEILDTINYLKFQLIKIRLRKEEIDA